ncbi:hypothetical protein C2S52_006025 [Perilla frutescens var. hirtella]|nr:hypothetical protein C2S52_006025 [Perilla frutescens var. hirtella]
MSSGRRSVGSPEGGGKSSVKEKGKMKLPELEGQYCEPFTTDAYFKYTILLRYFQSYDVGGMMHFEFSHDERGRLRAAGLSDEDALQRGSEGDARQPRSYNNLKLVDKDDDNQEDAIKPNFDDGMKDVSKANADDELEEVRLRKVSHSSASRRMRRENASKIGNLLRAATVSSSSCRRPEETKSEQSLAQLAKTILGMNVMLKSVVDRIFGVEELVHGLKRRLDGFRSVDDEATDGVDKEDPPEVAIKSGQPSKDFVEGRSGEKHVGDAGGVDSVDKGFTNQSFNTVSYPERQGGEAGVMDCVDILLNNESIVKVESGVERQNRDVGNTEIIDGVGNVESFKGVGHAERKGADCLPSQKVLDLLEQVFVDEVIYSHTQVHEAGAAENAEMEMTEAQSPEYEISDLEAYEPDCSPQKMDQENPPAKKRLFKEMSGSVEPCYGTICGDPLPKKRKTRGKNVAEKKPVKLSSLQWETFDPHREYDWPTERDFHHWYSHAKGENS